MKKSESVEVRELLNDMDDDIIAFESEEYQRHIPQYHAEAQADNYWTNKFLANQKAIPECTEMMNIWGTAYIKGKSIRECLILCREHLLANYDIKESK